MNRLKSWESSLRRHCRHDNRKRVPPVSLRNKSLHLVIVSSEDTWLGTGWQKTRNRLLRAGKGEGQNIFGKGWIVTASQGGSVPNSIRSSLFFCDTNWGQDLVDENPEISNAMCQACLSSIVFVLRTRDLMQKTPPLWIQLLKSNFEERLNSSKTWKLFSEPWFWMGKIHSGATRPFELIPRKETLDPELLSFYIRASKHLQTTPKSLYRSSPFAKGENGCSPF